MIEVPEAGDDEPVSMVESPSSVVMAVEVEAAAKEVAVLVEVVAVGGVAVTAEAFLACFFAAHFTRRVDPWTRGDAVAAVLVPKIFLKPVLNKEIKRDKRHIHSTKRESL